MIVLFATEKLPPDISAVLALVVLMATKTLEPPEALSGYASPVILLLIGIFIISAALVRTGMTEAAGRLVHRIMGSRPAGVMLGMTSTVALLSAWMNNTAVTPIFIPPAIGVARRLRLSPSRFLMPIAYASLLGGTCTLIGTSTNVAASGFLVRYGMEPIGMFELSKVGIVVAVVGVIYLSTIGWKFLPDRVPKTLDEDYRMKEFLFEVVVMPGSPMAGAPLSESGLGTALDLTVLAIHREGSPEILSPGPGEILREGDLLIVEGQARQIARVKTTRGIMIRADLHPSARDLTSDRVGLIEVMPLPNSDLIGRTLKEINFRGRYGVTAVGLYRFGESLALKVGKVRLRLGDVLLVQGRKEAIEQISHLPELEVLEDVTHFLLNRWKGILAITFFAAGVLAGSLKIVDLSIAILVAACLAVVAGCVPVRDLHRIIYWRMLLLIGGMMGFGVAMTRTGADRYLADIVVGTLQPWGTVPLLCGFFLLTVLLTQPMSNASACLVVLPIALSAAQGLHQNPRTYAVTVIIAASCAFLTPMEPSCLMVFGPGRYRFRDYAIAGAPLTLVVLVVTLLMVPRLWPV